MLKLIFRLMFLFGVIVVAQNKDQHHLITIFIPVEEPGDGEQIVNFRTHYEPLPGKTRVLDVIKKHMIVGDPIFLDFRLDLIAGTISMDMMKADILSIPINQQPGNGSKMEKVALDNKSPLQNTSVFGGVYYSPIFNRSRNTLEVRLKEETFGSASSFQSISPTYYLVISNRTLIGDVYKSLGSVNGWNPKNIFFNVIKNGLNIHDMVDLFGQVLLGVDVTASTYPAHEGFPIRIVNVGVNNGNLPENTTHLPLQRQPPLYQSDEFVSFYMESIKKINLTNYETEGDLTQGSRLYAVPDDDCSLASSANSTTTNIGSRGRRHLVCNNRNPLAVGEFFFFLYSFRSFDILRLPSWGSRPTFPITRYEEQYMVYYRLRMNRVVHYSTLTLADWRAIMPFAIPGQPLESYVEAILRMTRWLYYIWNNRPIGMDMQIEVVVRQAYYNMGLTVQYREGRRDFYGDNDPAHLLVLAAFREGSELLRTTIEQGQTENLPTWFYECSGGFVLSEVDNDWRGPLGRGRNIFKRNCDRFDGKKED